MPEALAVVTLEADESLRQMLHNHIATMDDVKLVSQTLNKDNWRRIVQSATPDILNFK